MLYFICFRFSPLIGVWEDFFFLPSLFTSAASCGPSSSDHSSWGGSTHPFSHEPQHRHTVHRHGEVPLQREGEGERENGKSKREECEECELTGTFVNRQNSSLWNWGRITLRYHMTSCNDRCLQVLVCLWAGVFGTDLLLLSERHQCQWLHGLILQNSSKLLILHVLWDLKRQQWTLRKTKLLLWLHKNKNWPRNGLLFLRRGK